MRTGVLFQFLVVVACCALSRAAQPPTENRLDLTARAFSRLDTSERGLLREFYDSYGRVKKFYENITINARERTFALQRPLGGALPAAPHAPLVLAEIKSLEFRANGGKYFRMDGTEFDVADPLKKTGERFGVITPTEGYLFGRNPTSDKIFVIANGKNPSEYVSDLAEFVFHTAPFSFGPVLLENLVFKNRVGTVDRIELQTDGGDQLVVMHLSYNKGDQWCRTTLRLYRQRSWAVKDIELEGSVAGSAGETCVTRQTCAYESGGGLVPLLTSCMFESSIKGGAKLAERVTHRDEFEITRIQPGPAPLSEFDVRQFLGVAKIGNIEKISYFRLVCIIVSVLVIVVAGGIRLRRGLAERAAHGSA